jgi:L-asparaginase II
MIEPHVVACHSDTPIKYLKQRPGYLAEPGGYEGVSCTEPVYASRAKVPLRIEECDKLAKDRSVRVDDQSGEFDHAVASVRLQPCRFNVNDTNTTTVRLNFAETQ